MIKTKGVRRFIMILIISVILTHLFIKNGLISADTIREKGNDFQYNIISLSTTIGGFLFTGISILISSIDKDRISRLWNNNYLDNLYRAGFTGIFSNIFSIIIALFLLCGKKMIDESDITIVLIKIEIISIVVGIVFFIWSALYLLTIIRKLKTNV